MDKNLQRLAESAAGAINPALRILLLEDDPHDVELVRETLAVEGWILNLKVVQSEPDFVAALNQAPFDLILADFTLPAFDGLSALAIAKQRHSSIPFIFVSATMGEEVAIESLKSGATDYVLKQRLSRLAPAVRRALREVAVETERQRAQQALGHLNRDLQMINACNQAMVRAKAEADLLQQVCQVLVQVGGYQMAWAEFAEPGQKPTGRLVAQSGNADEYLQGLQRTWADGPPGFEPTDRAIQSGQPVVVNDVSTGTSFEAWRAAALKCGYLSVLTLPLVSQGQPFGALSIYAAQPNAFDPKEIKLLLELTDDLAYGLIALRTRAERERAEHFLREQADLLDQVQDAIYVRDAAGRFLYWNRAAERLYGWNQGQIPQPAQPENLPLVLPQPHETEATAIWRYRNQDGSWRWLDSAGHRFRTSAGEERIVVVSRDITERKKAEETQARLEAQLRQAQKLEAVGTLAGGIAHDFNNILSAIISFAELAKDHMSGDRDVQEWLGCVLKASNRAKDLVRQILAFSRRTGHERQPISLQPVVKEAMKLLRSTLPATIEMVCEVPGTLPLIMADPTQIHQALMNLCTNAAQAMQGKVGRLEVRVQSIAAGPELVRLHPDLRTGPYVKLSVTDTGRGMDEETLKRIFEPFFTTKAPGEGTGLGLSVVHGIAKEHDGATCVSSQPGKGATFDLFFPALPAQSERPSESAKVPLLEGHGERILFVDDEQALGYAADRLLRRLRYQPTIQSNPRAALALFRSQPKAFDLVITDLTMPGMTGVDFASAILQTRPDTPILLATGFSGTWTPEMVRTMGILDVILKPLDLASLGQAIYKALYGNLP